MCNFHLKKIWRKKFKFLHLTEENIWHNIKHTHHFYNFCQFSFCLNSCFYLNFPKFSSLMFKYLFFLLLCVHCISHSLSLNIECWLYVDFWMYEHGQCLVIGCCIKLILKSFSQFLEMKKKLQKIEKLKK